MTSSAATDQRESHRKGAMNTWWSETRAVLVKDLRSEFRTKSALSSIFLFALTTLVLIGLTIAHDGLGLTLWWEELLKSDASGKIVKELTLVHKPTELRAQLLAGLYWLILYFSAMAGLPRVFVKEEEMGTAAALRLAARPTAVYTGKLLFNLLLMGSVVLLTLPLFLLLFEPAPKSWPLFLGHLFAGAAGMAGAATILGAIVARAANRSYLMLALGFGPVLPILVLGGQGTANAIYSGNGNNLVPLVSYFIAMVAVSVLLFEPVWGD